ncbi:MAG: hypothetical protein M1812_008245 [Candelaria pacifica]|nr:MAG: hypothetical protein M1812_008245 [Candelaria pacifica]
MVELKPSTTNASANSRPSRPNSPLQRLYSGQHLDDQSIYHHDDEVAKSKSSGSLAALKSSPAESEQDDGEGPGIESTESNEKDLERGPAKLEKQSSTKSVKDPNLVTWDGPDDPANPKNWTAGSKWAATLVVSSFTFISPVSSSAVAPALTSIASELNITNEVELQLTLSIFVLAYAIGPLILGPLSEVYGRVPVLQLSNLFFLVWNIACGFSRTKEQLIIFRFLSGLGGSAPLAIGGGVLSDCWRPEQRGRSISIYTLAPLLGPAVGPIAGGFIAENTTWRWAFHAISIADACIQLSGLFFLKETYAPKLLHRKADKLRKETGNEALHTEYEHPERTLFNLLKTSLARPFRLLSSQIIVQVLGVYMAYIYGLMYLVLSTFPSLWVTRYHESIGIGGLNYISLGLGFFLGTQICAPINDRIYRTLKKRNNGIGKPEFRVPLMVPGSILVPIGLFWYGWSAQAHTHWIMPNIGATIFAAGSIMNFQSIQTYLVDAYTRYAASAISAAAVLRSLAGFGFPLFAPAMYNALDFGWGNSLLGFLAIVLGVPAPFILWKFGENLRQKSPFAAGGGG